MPDTKDQVTDRLDGAAFLADIEKEGAVFNDAQRSVFLRLNPGERSRAAWDEAFTTFTGRV